MRCISRSRALRSRCTAHRVKDPNTFSLLSIRVSRADKHFGVSRADKPFGVPVGWRAFSNAIGPQKISSEGNLRISGADGWAAKQDEYASSSAFRDDDGVVRISTGVPGLPTDWFELVFPKSYHRPWKHYVGRIRDLQPHGPGILTFTDDSQHVGHFVNGIANGPGARFCQSPEKMLVLCTWKSSTPYGTCFEHSPHFTRTCFRDELGHAFGLGMWSGVATNFNNLPPQPSNEEPDEETIDHMYRNAVACANAVRSILIKMSHVQAERLKTALEAGLFFLPYAVDLGHSDMPDSLLKAAASARPWQLAPVEPLYEILESSNKGFGLFAKQEIAAQTCILSEDPLLTAHTDEALDRAVEVLSPEQAAVFWDLHDHTSNDDGTKTPKGIFSTNAFPIWPESNVGGLYPTLSRVNHSCAANSFAFRRTGHQYCLMASRDIKKGEEILTSYIPALRMPKMQRQKYLQENFGFECLCAVCSESQNESDMRRSLIFRLATEVTKIRWQPQMAMAASVHGMGLLLKEKGNNLLISRSALGMYQLHLLYNDPLNSLPWLKVHREYGLLATGADSTDARRAESLYQDPTNNEMVRMARYLREKQSELQEALPGIKLEVDHEFLI